MYSFSMPARSSLRDRAVLVCGPVTANMEEGLRKTYDAVPEPRIVIAVGACAIRQRPVLALL